MPLWIDHLKTEIGILECKADHLGITSVQFTEKIENRNPGPLTDHALCQLSEYFNGTRKIFDLPLQATGTSFQQLVWEKVLDIPYGSVRSYSEIASDLNKQNAAQAVGSANAQNDLLIIIPCHRVLGMHNKITGYAGGVQRKVWLLRHEGILFL